jgi:hypothetical protein
MARGGGREVEREVGLGKKVIGSRAARDLDLGLGSAGIEGW